MNLWHKIINKLWEETLLAMGRSSPNPPVACLLLYKTNGEYLMFSGSTEKLGKRHAEIVCLDKYHQERCKKDIQIEEVRLYVSLEPCTHFGRTPPCVQRITEESLVKRILIWEKDTSLKKPAKKLLIDSKKSTSYLLPQRNIPSLQTSLGKTFLGGFFKRKEEGRPRLHIKIACTKDNVTGLLGDRLIISDRMSLALGQMLRAKLDAVVVGMGTIVTDKPKLDLRYPQESFNKLSCQNGKNKNHYHNSNLVFALLKNLERIKQQIKDEFYTLQPDRIFILSRYTNSLEDFFKQQEELKEKTHKQPLYLVEESHAKEWKEKKPDLRIEKVIGDSKDKTNFTKTLFSFFKAREYNEVLIEGGTKTISNFENFLDQDDWIYIIRSHKSIKELYQNQKKEFGLNEKLSFVPKLLEKTKIYKEYNLGNDTIELRKL